MKTRTAVIVDDERIARSELAYLLREHPQIQIVAQAGTLDEAVVAVEHGRPDIIFLDVQLQGATGFDLFERTKVEAHVIFVTAFDEYALRAFEVNALDYLTKPVRPERLRLAIEHHLHRAEEKRAPTKELNLSDSILLTINRVPRFIKLSSLECVLAEGDYTQVICNGRSIGLILKSMKEWEQLLPVKHFCRIQRSVIVNCEHVLRFEPHASGGYEVHMRSLETPLIMSRRCARLFRSRFTV